MDRKGDLEGLPQSVKKFIGDNMVSKQAGLSKSAPRPVGGKLAVQTEEGVNEACPNCHGQKTKPVDDPEVEGGNLVECLTCGAFFAK